MALSISASELPNHIQNLLEQRRQHVEAITAIDHTLSRTMAAVGGASTPAAAPKGRPPAAPKAAAVKPGKTRTRSSFAVSASDLVVSFIKSAGKATTKEINKHLLSQGRSAGAVSNALSVLSKAKKLKRTPLGGGQLGSTYTVT